MNTWRVLRWYFSLPEMALVAVMVLAGGCTGCGSYVHGLGAEYGAGAVTGATTPEATKALGATLSTVAGGATAAARDEVLGPVTQADLDRLVRALGTQVRQQVLTLRDDALDAHLREEISKLREQLLGAPMRSDVDALIDEAAPHLAAALSAAVSAAMVPALQRADATATEYRNVAVGLGAASLALLAVLAFAVHELREHRKALHNLLAR